jgi:hypothetical protein
VRRLMWVPLKLTRDKAIQIDHPAWGESARASDCGNRWLCCRPWSLPVLPRLPRVAGDRLVMHPSTPALTANSDNLPSTLTGFWTAHLHDSLFHTGPIRRMHNALKTAFLFTLFGLTAVTVLVSLRDPSLSREWDDDARVLAGVEMQGQGLVRLTDIRDWSYTPDSVVSKRYFDASFDPQHIVDVWMYEQELDDTGFIAHTFLVFEFEESDGPTRYVGLSVETRRELGEEYSLIGGGLPEP